MADQIITPGISQHLPGKPNSFVELLEQKLLSYQNKDKNTTQDPKKNTNHNQYNDSSQHQNQDYNHNKPQHLHHNLITIKKKNTYISAHGNHTITETIDALFYSNL